MILELEASGEVPDEEEIENIDLSVPDGVSIEDPFNHMHRDTYSPCLVSYRPCNSLAYPPGSISAELKSKVLKLRFGLEDGRARTLEEVGKEFKVTRERIRQIEAKALRKLRHPSRSLKVLC